MYSGTAKQKCFILKIKGVIRTNGVLYIQHFVKKLQQKFNSWYFSHVSEKKIKIQSI